MSKKIRTVKINVCFVENADPKDVFPPAQEGVMGVMGNLPNTSFKFKRLLKKPAAPAFEAMATDGNQLAKKKTFKQLYESMSEPEKKLHRIWTLELPEGSDLDAVLRELSDNPNVEFAKQEVRYKPCTSPNDPYYPNMYGLQQIKCEDAWSITEGQDVVVAVVDTGVDYNHPDIRDNMWTDANGNYGRDFSGEGASTIEDDDPMDTHGHGTHVAGTIAAIKNNQIGIAGVAPKVKIMAVKIFPHATDQVIARALKYAVDNGARVLNNSWGPTDRDPSSPVIEAAVDYVHAHGGICVFAAGNSNDDVQYYSPANRPNTISVGATDHHSNRAGFSNYGALVDVAAPGVGILSLRRNTTNYHELSGTSMAAPHVSGLVAMLLHKNPALSFDEILAIITSTADPLQVSQPIGSGRINCLNALQFGASLPNFKVVNQVNHRTHGEYLVEAKDQAGNLVSWEIVQNGMVLGHTNQPFSLPINCVTEQRRVRVCEPDRRPPCWWETLRTVTCEPENTIVFARTQGSVAVRIILPGFQTTE